ncbi:C25 family cysteine peptidase [Candidatus Amarolinea aalborgensis]|uniref:C25 family cysteine peptidase n=1 Tax=Candidatus Amarolinea aalborgensis TaxID=2249329 RepID=UPI003BF9AD7D
MKPIPIIALIASLLLPTFSNAAPLTSTVSATTPRSADDSAELAPANLRVLSTSDTAIVLALDTPTYQISQMRTAQGAFDTIQVADYAMTQEPGQPQLPMQASLIAIPPGALVTAEVIASDSQVLPERLNLLPTPRQVTPDVDPAAMAAADASGLPPKPILVYESNRAPSGGDIFPAQLVHVGEAAYVRDQRVVSVQLFPFQANLATGAVTFYQHLQVALQFSYPDGAAAQTPAAPAAESPYMESMLRSAVLNYDSATTWRQRSTDARPLAAIPPAPTAGEFRLSVTTDGLYRVTYAALVAAGLNPNSVNPQQFALTNQGAAIAIYVAGEADGRFDPSDYIEFYGKGWNSYYSNTNVYWLDVDGPAGPRMTTRNVTPGNASTPTTFRFTSHQEAQEWRWTQHMRENRTWWWQKYTLYDNPSATQVTATLSLSLPGVAVQTQPVGVRVAMASNTDYAQNPDHHVRAYLNDTSTIVDERRWNGRDPIELAGTTASGNLLPGANTLSLRAMFDMGTQYAYDIYYLDWVEITYDRLYAAENGELYFSPTTADTWRFSIGGFTTPARAFDITNPSSPVRLLNSQLNGGQLTLQDTAGPGTRFYAVGDNALRTPTAIQRYAGPTMDLRATNQRADYLIIAHANFMNAVQPLAQFRTSQGMVVKVIDVAWLYDQFNAGVLDPQAIKNFIDYAYHQWGGPAPSFVLLVGDANFNPMGYNQTYYGPWEQTYVPTFNLVIDPYTGEVAVDNEFVTVSGNDILPDLYIGRMPAQTAAQVTTMVNKTIGYERTTPPADWRQHNLFVADNYLSATGAPDPAGNFEQIIQSVIDDSIPNWYAIDRVYYDPYPNRPPDSWRYPTIPQARDAVAAAINNGALFTNYVGHATIDKWAENLWTTDDISLLNNLDRLTIGLSMDCLDGYFDWPNRPSLAETMLEYANGGTVAHWAPTGLGVVNGHDVLHKGFFSAINSNGIKFFGGAVTVGRLNLAAQGGFPDLVQTFMMFGDPALRFVAPASPQELRVSLSSTPGDVVGIGSAVTYQIRYANNGSIAAANATLNFTLPAGLIGANYSFSGPAISLRAGSTYIWDIPSIPIGATGIITVQAQVNPAITANQTPIITTATLRNRWTEPDISNNSARVRLDVLLADRYETDDTQATAAALPGIGLPMRHTLHTNADVDWIWFDAQANQRYFLHTGQLTGSGDTVLTLFAANGAQLGQNNDFIAGVRWSGLLWTAPSTGRYTMRIAAQGAPGPFAYDVTVDWQKQVFLPSFRK